VQQGTQTDAGGCFYKTAFETIAKFANGVGGSEKIFVDVATFTGLMDLRSAMGLFH
jgi:hypothetical protein